VRLLTLTEAGHALLREALPATLRAQQGILGALMSKCGSATLLIPLGGRAGRSPVLGAFRYRRRSGSPR
jgi:hypothetical protein